VPLTVRLTLVRADGDTPVEGAAVYLWHCNRDGAYSMYDRSVADENYLRGVQTSAADGTVTFTSIFPACYAGRWPHVHFEVYKSLDEATAAGQILATSQLALPQDVCSTVYATTGYEQSVSNLSRVSLTRDMVFGDDGGASQLATMTGSVSGGYTPRSPWASDGSGRRSAERLHEHGGERPAAPLRRPLVLLFRGRGAPPGRIGSRR
jgi:protocatechuate 3,4-dioxygenase beta subunit